MKTVVKNIIICGAIAGFSVLVAAKHIAHKKDVTFELFNSGIRKDQTLYVYIPGMGIHEIGPQQKLQEKIDVKKNVLIRFYQSKPYKIHHLIGGVPKIGEYKLKAKNKNKYVMFVWNKGLEPQAGPLHGLLGVTFSGLSTKNNIVSNQIQVVKKFDFSRVKK